MTDLRTPRSPSFMKDSRASTPPHAAHFGRVLHPRATPVLGEALEPRHHERLALDLELKAARTPGQPPSPPPPPAPAAPGPGPADAAQQPPPPAVPNGSPGARREGGSEAHQGLTTAIESLRLAGSHLAEQARADALELGFQIARRILEVEIAARPEPLFSLVRSAVRRLGDARRLVVRLHPDDAALVDTPEGKQSAGLTLQHVEVVPDTTLARGDCLVEADGTEVDGRLSTRLDEVRRSVTAALEDEESP